MTAAVIPLRDISHATRRPTLLIDMDGPLADFDGKFYDLSKSFFGPYTFDFDDYWEDRPPSRQRFLTDNMEDEHAKAMRAMVNNTRWFRDLPVVSGSLSGMAALEALTARGEIDTYICTKPLEANPWCRDDKAAWLKEHYGDFWLDRLIIAPNKAMVRGDILLDDAIKPKWVDHENPSWRPVVFDEPFNQPGTKHGRDWPRFTWADSVYKLLDIACEAMQ